MGREDMTCRNCGECPECGEPVGDNVYMCAHCQMEYHRENNEREDLRPLTEDMLDDMYDKWNKTTARWKLDLGMDSVLNRGI